MIAFGLALASAGGGCDRESKPTRARRDATVQPVPVDAATVIDAGEGAPSADLGAPPLAYPAVRCSECHAKMFDEWTDSGHAQARQSPVYQRMRDLAKDASCDRCHAPLASRLPARDRTSDEGVTCEVCHTIKDVEVKHAGAGFTLRLGENVKYGPLCDADDHYFHKMGCSPLHQSSELCAGCHLYYRKLPGGDELPVFTEYDEWRTGPVKARTCQSCHMPGTRAEVASGSAARDDVANHGLLGAKGDLRKRALRGTVTATAAGPRIQLAITLRNIGAGHFVPTGLPDRRIVVRATTVAAGGAPHATTEHRLGRHLVDAKGKPAPFYLATRVALDDRIPPKGERKVSLELDAPGTETDTGELRIEILWRALDPEIASLLQIDDVEEQVLLRAKVPVKTLPRTIELK